MNNEKEFNEAIQKAAYRCNEFYYLYGSKTECVEITHGYVMALADVFQTTPQMIEEAMESIDWQVC